MSLLRTGFADQFFATQLPLLDEVVMEKYKSYADMIPIIFNQESSDTWGWQKSEVSGFGLVPESSENTDVTYDDVYQGNSKTKTHSLFKMAFRTSKEMVDDGKFDVPQKAAQALGRSMFNTRQILAASVFNNAFDPTYTGYDGLELCSLLHPAIGGGFVPNELATPADLSNTSLEELLWVLEDTTDDRGLLLNIQPKYLLVPNELKRSAAVILLSEQKSATSNNDINPFQLDSLEYVGWNYLTDPDAWFILGDKGDHSLLWSEREPVNVTTDYDFDADASKTKIRNRCSVDWYGFRGVVGSPGA